MTLLTLPAAARLLLASCALAACAAAAQERLTILHTNDHHGRFWRNAEGEYGLAARKTVIDRVRQEVAAQGGHLLLLDAGDVNTGIPESDLQAAEPDFRGMSALGYQAMAVGNHEFDRSLAVLRRQRDEWSSFPWLSANVYRRGVRMFEPYRIFQLGKLRVAVLGLTSEDTGRMLIEQRFPEVRFTSPAQEAARLVPELRQRADLVIGLTHLGHYPDGKHGSNSPGDVELARTVAGFDAIVGGHSHSPLCMLQENVRDEAYEPGAACQPDRQNGSWIVQASEWGKFLGRADFEVADGKLRLVRYTLIPVNLKRTAPIPEDRAILELLAPFKERAAAGLSVVVGRTDNRFEGDRKLVRTQPTSLGRLVASAMRAKTRADFALVNGGGIRDSLPAGPITYGDLLKVQPFGNRVIVVAMTGAELRGYLDAALRMSPGSGGFPQYAGLEVRGPGEIYIKGERLDPAARYRMAVNSFVARGGDGYPDLSTRADYLDTGWIDVEVLREFVAARPVLRAQEYESIH